MGLLSGDFWDDVVDIRDKHKKEQSVPMPPKGSGPPKYPVEKGKKAVSGNNDLLSGAWHNNPCFHNY